MPRARREANLVRSEIIEGIREYAESRRHLVTVTIKRRDDEARRKVEATCGTVCRDIPIEFLPYMPGWLKRRPAADEKPSFSLN